MDENYFAKGKKTQMTQVTNINDKQTHRNLKNQHFNSNSNQQMSQNLQQSLKQEEPEEGEIITVPSLTNINTQNIQTLLDNQVTYQKNYNDLNSKSHFPLKQSLKKIYTEKSHTTSLPTVSNPHLSSLTRELDEFEDIILSTTQLSSLKQNSSILQKIRNTKLRQIIKAINNAKFKKDILEKILKEDKNFRLFADEILHCLGFAIKNENGNQINGEQINYIIDV